MADNVAITAGSGTTIAADDVAGVLVQRVKVTWGPDGTANDVDDATGKRLPVEVAEPLPAGTNNIGDVDVLSLPALAAGTNAIGKLAANSGVDIGDVDVTSIAAGENVIGKVGASDIQVQVTPTMDTSAYTGADVWFTATEIANAARTSGGVTILQSVTILDKDDQTAAGVDLYFFDRTVTLGTINAAVSISDADAAYYQGHVSIASGDWKDLINSKVACKAGIGLAMKANATSLYVAAVTSGTPTQSASGVVLTLTFLRS